MADQVSPKKLKALYAEGKNISEYLRQQAGLTKNSREIIEIVYDLQTGSYVNAMQNEALAKRKALYTREIADTVLDLCSPASILEAGVGEATTMSGVLEHLPEECASYGFDLSWSRVSYARKWLQSRGIRGTRLCSADLFNIPLADNAVDIVYTAHSIEPNGGSEAPILRELFRICKRYLILLEPGFELADEEARQRMIKHGYCQNLKGEAEQLGCDVIEHKLFRYCMNDRNPTAITIIKKSETAPQKAAEFVCPMYKTPLETIDGQLFSSEAQMVYPVLAEIPCLRVENGIYASKYEEIVSP